MCTIVRKVCVVFLVVFSTILATPVFGQHDYYSYPDTIRLQMPNGTTIEYAMRYERDLVKYDRQKLQEEKELKEKIGAFLKRWEVLGVTNLETKKPLFIEDLETKIEISERNQKTTVLFPKDTKVALIVKGKHKLKLKKKGNNVYIYFDKIQQLKELENYNFEQILKNSDKQLDPASADRKNKRRPLRAWLSVDENDEVGLTYQKFLRKNKRHYFYIDLINSYIENVNGNWLVGTGIGINYVLNSDFRFGLRWEGMYNFSDKQETNINQWVDMSVATSEARDYGISWFGFSFGYLVDKRGDFFNNHKFRIGIPFNISQNVTVTPQFYFKDFFKTSKDTEEYFGVRLSFSF